MRRTNHAHSTDPRTGRGDRRSKTIRLLLHLTGWQLGMVIHGMLLPLVGQRKLNLPKLRMHRLIALPLDHQEIDHVDRNGLHNRRSNLRIATRRQNTLNRRTESTSGYYGCIWNAKRNLPSKDQSEWHTSSPEGHSPTLMMQHVPMTKQPSNTTAGSQNLSITIAELIDSSLPVDPSTQVYMTTSQCRHASIQIQ